MCSARSQLSLLHPHGDLLTPGVVTGSTSCNFCVGAQEFHQNFTDTSSFQGMSIATTVLSLTQPIDPAQLSFQVWTLGSGDIEITHVASDIRAVPLPATLPLFATGLGVLGLLGWRRNGAVHSRA